MSAHPEPAVHEVEVPPSPPARRRLVPLAIGGMVVVLVTVLAIMQRKADAGTNQVALASRPKPVTVVVARATTYRATREYVGTIEPWVEAKIGPQLVSAYVDTVLVRPGAVAKKGQVLATLDCRNTHAANQAVAREARALEARQKALAHEAARVQGLLNGGFVSPNEAEQKSAQSSAELAQLLASLAKLAGRNIEVNDCILRAPFDGEIVARSIDPGAFVRPGASIVTVVDRSVVRITADAPEIDFDVVAPGTVVKIHCLATQRDLVARISRRAPGADTVTRTTHFELDVPNADRSVPVGTTAELRIETGSPMAAVELPLLAASVRGSKASIFVVEDGRAHARVLPVKGETAGTLYLDPALRPGTHVVTQGRALLSEGDAVSVAVQGAGAASVHAEP